MLMRVPMAATKEDFLRVCAANPEARLELDAEGQISLAPPAFGASAERNAKLAVMVGLWAEEHGYVAFDSSAGFELPSKAIFSPDAALVERSIWTALRAEQREDFVPLLPVVAIEIVSKSDRPAETRAKLKLFREAGTAYVVLIDPYRDEIWTDGTPPAEFTLDFTPLLK